MSKGDIIYQIIQFELNRYLEEEFYRDRLFFKDNLPLESLEILLGSSEFNTLSAM